MDEKLICASKNGGPWHLVWFPALTKACDGETLDADRGGPPELIPKDDEMCDRCHKKAIEMTSVGEGG